MGTTETAVAPLIGEVPSTCQHNSALAPVLVRRLVEVGDVARVGPTRAAPAGVPGGREGPLYFYVSRCSRTRILEFEAH